MSQLRSVVRILVAAARLPIASDESFCRTIVSQLTFRVEFTKNFCGQGFPSSTPHWSKELIPQIQPRVNTLRSHTAIS